MKSASSATTIANFRNLFANHGIPESIVPDNGSPFTSIKIKFLIPNGVKQIPSSPYYPSSNDLTECAILMCKSELKKMDGSSLDIKIQFFLLNYRTTPQGNTDILPFQLLMGRQLRTHLDHVIPDLAKHVQDAQFTQKRYHDEHTRDRNFSPGQRVLVRNYAVSPCWLPGII